MDVPKSDDKAEPAPKQKRPAKRPAKGKNLAIRKKPGRTTTTAPTAPTAAMTPFNLGGLPTELRLAVYEEIRLAEPRAIVLPNYELHEARGRSYTHVNRRARLPMCLVMGMEARIESLRHYKFMFARKMPDSIGLFNEMGVAHGSALDAVLPARPKEKRDSLLVSLRHVREDPTADDDNDNNDNNDNNEEEADLQDGLDRDTANAVAVARRAAAGWERMAFYAAVRTQCLTVGARLFLDHRWSLVGGVRSSNGETNLLVRLASAVQATMLAMLTSGGTMTPAEIFRSAMLLDESYASWTAFHRACVGMDPPLPPAIRYIPWYEQTEESANGARFCEWVRDVVVPLATTREPDPAKGPLPLPTGDRRAWEVVFRADWEPSKRAAAAYDKKAAKQLEKEQKRLKKERQQQKWPKTPKEKRKAKTQSKARARGLGHGIGAEWCKGGNVMDLKEYTRQFDDEYTLPERLHDLDVSADPKAEQALTALLRDTVDQRWAASRPHRNMVGFPAVQLMAPPRGGRRAAGVRFPIPHWLTEAWADPVTMPARLAAGEPVAGQRGLTVVEDQWPGQKTGLVYHDCQFVDPAADLVVVEACPAQDRCWFGFVNQLLAADRQLVQRLAVLVPPGGFQQLNVWDTLTHAFPNVRELVYVLNGRRVLGCPAHGEARHEDAAVWARLTHDRRNELTYHDRVYLDDQDRPAHLANLFYLRALPGAGGALEVYYQYYRYWLTQGGANPGPHTQEYVELLVDEDADPAAVEAYDAENHPKRHAAFRRDVPNYYLGRYDDVDVGSLLLSPDACSGDCIASDDSQPTVRDWAVLRIDRHAAAPVAGTDQPAVCRHSLDVGLNNIAFRQWKATPTTLQGATAHKSTPLRGGQDRPLARLVYAYMAPKIRRPAAGVPLHTQYNAQCFGGVAVLGADDVLIG